MAFTLIPRELKFFDLFDQAADVVDRTSERFLQLVTEFDRLAERNYEIREDQRLCEDILRRTVEAAEQSFVTPFDREDIHALIQAVHELVNALEQAASRFEIFRIERPTPEAAVLTRILRDRCRLVAAALRLCRDWKNVDGIRGRVHDVLHPGYEASRLRRDCDAALFADPPDVLDLIKWRDLYDSLHEAGTACRRVAQALSGIVVKGT
jgi:uncharacterized protein Yka (UPF0111/DUF47 family)